MIVPDYRSSFYIFRCILEFCDAHRQDMLAVGSDAISYRCRCSRLWSIEGAAQRQYKANRLLLARRSSKLANAAFVLAVLVDKSQECGLHNLHEPSPFGSTI